MVSFSFSLFLITQNVYLTHISHTHKHENMKHGHFFSFGVFSPCDLYWLNSIIHSNQYQDFVCFFWLLVYIIILLLGQIYLMFLLLLLFARNIHFSFFEKEKKRTFFSVCRALYNRFLFVVMMQMDEKLFRENFFSLFWKMSNGDDNHLLLFSGKIFHFFSHQQHFF